MKYSFLEYYILRIALIMNLWGIATSMNAQMHRNCPLEYLVLNSESYVVENSCKCFWTDSVELYLIVQTSDSKLTNDDYTVSLKVNGKKKIEDSLIYYGSGEADQFVYLYTKVSKELLAAKFEVDYKGNNFVLPIIYGYSFIRLTINEPSHEGFVRYAEYWPFEGE